METQRLFLYLALGFILLLLYQAWVQDYHMPATVTAPVADTPEARAPLAEPPGEADLPTSPAASNDATLVDIPGSDDVAPPPVAEADRRIRVRTDLLDVEIDTVGGTLIGTRLLDYPVSIEQPDEPFTLVSDEPDAFLVLESGLASTDGRPAPSHTTPMQASGTEFRLDDNDDRLLVPLTWTSPDGIQVTKTFVFERDSYEIGLDYRIVNPSDSAWPVRQYRQIKRKPATDDERQQFIYTYIGGVVSNEESRYSKIDFDDMQDENLESDATDGWVAMIQHYFATAWVPPAGEANTAYTRFLPDENRYRIGLVSGTEPVPAGGEASFSSTAFVGPKIQERLAAAGEHLELTVDYGWLTILAQPLFWLLSAIHGIVGNWGWAIVGVTLVVKAVFYKLSEAGYKSMARMKALQPKLMALKERYGDDRAKMGQATMELYKKEKVNPLGGCLPMLVQIPVFIALYWTLLESVELRQAPWILWIEDLSIRDPYFILPVIMAVSMYVQQRLNPAPVDPIQAKVFQFLPLVFGIFFAFFPAGLVLYWVVNNTLSIAQQYYITRHVIGNKPQPADASG